MRDYMLCGSSQCKIMFKLNVYSVFLKEKREKPKLEIEKRLNGELGNNIAEV